MVERYADTIAQFVAGGGILMAVIYIWSGFTYSEAVNWWTVLGGCRILGVSLAIYAVIELLRNISLRLKKND